MIVENYRREYNGLLDIMKFIFSLLIVFSHGIFLAAEGERLVFGYALIGVEFFFLLSGYFLMSTIYSRQLNLKDFVTRRIKGLYLYFLVSYIFCFICWLCLQLLNEYPGKWILLTRILKAPFDLFFMYSSGISTAGINGTWWYISAMLFVEWLLFPIIRYKEKVYAYYLAPLGIFLISGYMSFKFGSISTGDFSGFIKTDNLRALLGIMMGTMMFYGVEKIRKYRLKKKILCVCNVIAVLGYGLVFLVAYNNTGSVHEYTDGNLGFSMPLILTLSVGITCLNSFTKWKKICKWLGKMSTCIYFTHWSCMEMIKFLYERKILRWGGWNLSRKIGCIVC